jgi:nucleoside-diphosphate-sugar epimerase
VIFFGPGDSRGITLENPIPTTKMSYILLSGATGMLGAVILKQLLAADHKVNAILRSFSRSKAALSAQYPAAVQSGQLTLTEIPDMGVDGVFDEPLQGASNFIHAATPLGTKDFYETIIKPVSVITENVLKSAANAPHLKRLVITGSMVSTFKIPDELLSGKTLSEKDFSSVTLEEGKSNLGYAYSYSKVTSEKEAWAFIEKNKPKFELVYLLAPSITGKNIQVGWKPTKGHLGGASGLYKNLFDVEKPGPVFPYFM